MPAHDHHCRSCGTVLRTGCQKPCRTEEGWCPTCRDEAVLLGLFIASDVLADGELDGDFDDDL